MAIRKYAISDIVSIIIKRRWLILVPFAVGLALTPLLARYAPERFRSEALIVVKPQQVPDAYVKATVNETVAERLPAISNQILSRSKLESIILEMDLYKAERARWVMEDVYLKMRDDITTSPVGREVNSFRIGYTSDNAETAWKVTGRLADLYREANSQDRTNQAENTSSFLDTQLAESKRQLVEQEKKLEEYNKAHAGELPSQLQGNLQAIQNANLQLQAVNESTNRAQEKRLFLERQIADAEALAAAGTAAAAAAAGTAIVPATADAQIPLGPAQQLDQARARLAFLLQRYHTEHPEVVSLTRTIADLQATVDRAIPVSPPDEKDPKTAPPTSPAELAAQKRILDLRAELAVIDYQLAANRTEEAKLKQAITSYQAKVDALPTRQSELVDLTRDYSTMQAAYGSLLLKRQDAVIAANLEERQIGEQFNLVDSASRPERPSNQRERIAVTVSGAVAGFLLGLVLTGLLELRDTSYRSADEVLKALSIPVVASIPMMTSEREQRAAKRRDWILDAAGTACLLGAATVLLLWRMQ